MRQPDGGKPARAASVGGFGVEPGLSPTGSPDGGAIDVAGSIPVAFTDWGIQTPAGFGWLGSIADRGETEFLLVLDHA